MQEEEESLHNLLSESINKQMNHDTGGVINHNVLMDGNGEAVENETQVLINQSNRNVRSGRYLKWINLVFLMIVIIIIVIIYIFFISK